MGQKIVYYCDSCKAQRESLSKLCGILIEINHNEIIYAHCCTVECAITAVDEATNRMRTYVDTTIRESFKK